MLGCVSVLPSGFGLYSEKCYQFDESNGCTALAMRGLQ